MKKNRRKIDQKRPKIDEKSVSAAFGRSGSFQVAPVSRGNALGTASESQVGPSWPPSWPFRPPCWPSWTPSWQPGARQTALESHLRTRAQARTAFVSIFRRFCYDRGKPEPQFSSASAVFRTLRTKLAPNAHGSRKTTKIDIFRPQNRAREPRNRARAALGERKIARGSAKKLRIFKSRAERAGQSAERAHVAAEIDDALRGLRTLFWEPPIGYTRWRV